MRRTPQSLLRASPCEVNATAPTHLYVLSEGAFAAMLKKQPRIEDKILTGISERMRYR